MENDVYRTIEANAEALFKEKSSKFLCFAYPVTTEEQIREHLEVLYKKYYDATHHCYAWRLGPRGESFRANDDGDDGDSVTGTRCTRCTPDSKRKCDHASSPLTVKVISR